MAKERITSIDALRAVTLLGILIVHVKGGFGFQFEKGLYGIDIYISEIINLFLRGKCNTIFSMLFGVSFYLILRNPANGGIKFFWRCFLLMLIGFFNKLFYTYDALMWYGFCGMCLVPIRNMNVKKIFIIFLIFLVLSTMLKPLSIGHLLFGEIDMNRYGGEKSLSDIIRYKFAIQDYLRVVFNGGIFGTYALFVLGYWLARVGIIDNLKEKITRSVVCSFWCLFIVSFLAFWFTQEKIVIEKLNNYLATFAYASTVLYVYYHYSFIRKFLEKLEPYGKLGLTNYSMQGIFGVLLMGTYSLGLCQESLHFTLCIFLFFYLIQAIFSYYWLKVYKYGPMEYVWRVFTERKLIQLRKSN